MRVSAKPYSPTAHSARQQPEIREPLQEPANGNTSFHSRKGQPDTDMRTTGKGQMAVWFAADIQLIRGVKHTRIAIGRPHEQMQIGAR